MHQNHYCSRARKNLRNLPARYVANLCSSPGTNVRFENSHFGMTASCPPTWSLKTLVKLYYRDLYRFGLSLTGSEADAADLTQETFYIWANKGHQLQKAASVKSWLFTTLHREFLKTCRRRSRFSHQSIDESTEDLPDVPADCAERAIRKRCFAFWARSPKIFVRRWCSIIWKICPIKRSPTFWCFRSARCSRGSRARKFSFCAG